ncbi:CHAT domain-containing tetratricopeptide repeat protein [Nonomuraea wenchangensis]
MMGFISRRLRVRAVAALERQHLRAALVNAHLAVLAAERSSDARELDRALLHLAALYTGLGHAPRAAEYARRRIALAEQAGDDLLLASALIQYGETSVIGGRPAEGAEDVRRALALLGDREPPAPTTRWSALSILGEATRQAGLLDASSEVLEHAYRRCAQAGQEEDAALTAAQLIQVSLALGQTHRAVEWGRCAEEHLGRLPGGPPGHTAEVFGNLGHALALLGRHDEAAAAIGTALRMSEGIPVLHRQGLLVAAETARCAARHADAIGYLDRWLARAHPSDRRGRALALNLRALVRMAEGDFDRAEGHLAESLELKREVGDVRGVAVALMNLIRLNLDTGRPERAKSYAPECEALWSTFIERAPDEPGLAGLHGKIVYPLSQALQELHLAAGEPYEALRVAERGRFGPLAAQVRAARTERQSVPAEPPDLDRIGGLARQLNVSLLYYQAHFDFMRTAIGVDPLATLHHLREIHAWAIGPDGRRAHERVPADVFTALLETGGNVPDSRDIPDLGPVLLRPFKDLLAADRPVVVVPDWILWELPFAAFTLEEGVQLIERHPVTHAQSVHLLELLAADPLRGPARAPLIVSAPEDAKLPHPDGGFEDATALDARETEPIAALYGVEPLTGAACTIDAVRERLRGADLVHVYAHAFLDAHLRLDRPPGIIALTPSADDDGRLTSDMIAAEALRAGLVVLASCHSASGLHTPEGVRGLVRAFFVGGAERVVAMSREVPAVPAARIAAMLHEELRRGGSAADAFRAALLRGREAYPDPAIWGSFVLHGLP